MPKSAIAATSAATLVALLLVHVSTVLAIRPATRAEADAIQRDLNLAGCNWRAAISTVDTDWARIEADPSTCLAVMTLDTSAHLKGHRWTGSPWIFDLQRCAQQIPRSRRSSPGTSASASDRLPRPR